MRNTMAIIFKLQAYDCHSLINLRFIYKKKTNYKFANYEYFLKNYRAIYYLQIRKNFTQIFEYSIKIKLQLESLLFSNIIIKIN